MAFYVKNASRNRLLDCFRIGLFAVKFVANGKVCFISRIGGIDGVFLLLLKTKCIKIKQITL